jgi:hypothetical protein
MSAMPYYKVKEEEFNPELVREIRRVRAKNKDAMGKEVYEREYCREGSPPLDNLILLTAIDEYLNKNP